jgi:aspartyl-tRNA synthetase
MSTQVLAHGIMIQLSELEKASFGHLLDALKYGAPPHGGIALGNQLLFLFQNDLIDAPSGLGFDRLMTILCRAESIREVIAFPKTSVGTDLLFKSPTTVDNEVLYQYGIQPRT